MVCFVTALLLAVLLNANVRRISAVVDAGFTSNDLSPLLTKLDNSSWIFDPKNKTYTLVGFEPSDESNSTTALPTEVHDVSNHTELTERNDVSTILENRIDDHGCDTQHRDELEDECYDHFQEALMDASDIEDEEEKGKFVCCAAEAYEKCCVAGYLEANCEADRNAIKENLKAARIFMATLSSTSCAKHRGKCDFNSASSPSLPSLFLVSVVSLLILL